MNVRELITALSRLDPELPVVIEQEDVDFVGTYVELMSIKRSDNEIYRDHEAFSLDGSRPYDRADWHCTEAGRAHPTEPAVIVNCRVPYKPTIDAEVIQPELPGGAA